MLELILDLMLKKDRTENCYLVSYDQGESKVNKQLIYFLTLIAILKDRFMVQKMCFYKSFNLLPKNFNF